MYSNLKYMKRSIHFTLLLLISTFSLFESCNSDDIKGNLYTFKSQTMGQYLQSKPEVYSEFCRALDTTHVMGLLKTYGYYTCFAPDNVAMKAFYQSMHRPDLSDFSMDSIKQIVYDHIVMDWAVPTIDFTDGQLPHPSMSDRFFYVRFGGMDPVRGTDSIFINQTSYIIEKDLEVNNGVIHRLSEVLNPIRKGVAEVISQDSTFSLFYKGLLETGLIDSLLQVKDESYKASDYQSLITVTKDMTGYWYHDVPPSRYFRYTVLMESNATMAANNITDLESLKAYAASVYDEVYPEDANVTDFTDRRNSLNRFIAYHLITKQLSHKLFIDAYDTDHMIKTRDMYEYIETMCPNTLIEVSKVRSTNETNLLNNNKETGKVVHLVSTNWDHGALNGIYHEIDHMLVYDASTDLMLSTKRLRFDSSSFFDELTNNNMRGLGILAKEPRFQLPRGYIKRITCSEQTVVGYLCPWGQFQDYEGDEIYLRAATGKLYDFSIETLPIPAGNYEVRFGYIANGNRGVAQLYFDGIPAGVPLNLMTSSTSAQIGYVTPHTLSVDWEGYENDKMMRNRGYMKGPACFRAPQSGFFTLTESSRYEPTAVRRIMGIYKFKTAGRHVLGVKGLSGGEFMFDYMEFVPTSVLETEDIN